MSRLVALALLLLWTGAEAAPDKALYELQERCGQSATAWFKAEFHTNSSAAVIQNTKDGQSINNFRNHYNARLNACMVLETTTGFVTQPNKPARAYSALVLLNLNENNELGSYWAFETEPLVMSCALGDSKCHSKQEFEALVKPYMTE